MRRAVFALACLAALPAVAQDAATGAETYAIFCATCHGADATGAGPMSEVLTVAPPDLTRITERAGGTFPVLGVVGRIDGRDPMLAHGSIMPIFGTYFDGGPGVAIPTAAGQPVLTSGPVADLVVYLQSIQR